MAELTVYPDPGTGSTTVDGFTGRFRSAGEDWAVIRPGAGTTSDDTQATNSAFFVRADNNTDKWDIIYRYIATFDTSALTSGATISGAVLSVYPTVITDELTDSMSLVGSTPANNNAVVDADFETFNSGDGATLYASARALSGLSTGSYQDFTMNAAGLAAIVKDGITPLGFRSEYDRSNTEPTWHIDVDTSTVTIRSADTAGTASDPKLVITYILTSELTVYPDPGTGATTVDGRVVRTVAAGELWATIRSAAVGTLVGRSEASQRWVCLECDGTNTDNYDQMWRGIATLDTSALTGDATILAATFSIYGTSIVDGFAELGELAIVSSAPAADNDLEIGDYDSLGDALFAPVISSTGWNTSGYNDFSFNAAGLAGISKTGITKLGTRSEFDRADTEPTWASNTDLRFYGHFADETGTDKDPKLVITYTTPPSTTSMTFAIVAVSVVGLQRKPTRVLPITAVAVTGFARKVSKPFATIAVGVVGFLRKPTKALPVTAVAVVGLSRKVSRVFPVVSVGVVGLTRKVAKTLSTTAVTVIGLLRKTSKTFATTAVAVTGFTRKVSKTFATIAVAVVGFSSTRIVKMTFAIIAVANVGFSRKVTKTFPVVATAVVGIGKRISKTWAVIVKAVVGFTSSSNLPPWDLSATLSAVEIIPDVHQAVEIAPDAHSLVEIVPDEHTAVEQ